MAAGFGGSGEGSAGFGLSLFPRLIRVFNSRVEAEPLQQQGLSGQLQRCWLPCLD